MGQSSNKLDYWTSRSNPFDHTKVFGTPLWAIVLISKRPMLLHANQSSRHCRTMISIVHVLHRTACHFGGPAMKFAYMVSVIVLHSSPRLYVK